MKFVVLNLGGGLIGVALAELGYPVYSWQHHTIMWSNVLILCGCILVYSLLILLFWRD